MGDEKSSLGLSPNVAAALAYVFGFVSGIIVFILENDNKFVRFHSMQSIILSVAFFVLAVIVGFIPVTGPLLGILVSIASLICWLIGIIKAARGEFFKFPVIGDFAEKQI
ncbi:MAG: DUF4870 domain-containing protein [Eubacteriales bacterium]